MPTYQYKCRDCGHVFEKFQMITEEPLQKCPVCGGHVERIISGGVGLLFKGHGFYITDHRSENYKKAAALDKQSPTTTESTAKPGKK